MIEVKNLTLTYPNGKGVFNLDFKVNKGTVVGYIGPNGAGKTTTIRALLGFMTPIEGSCSIDGLDSFDNAMDIQKKLGYVPGEISFIENMNGDEFLKFMNDMRGTKDLSKQNELIELFELNTKGKIKKFSKGMKQKLGIVSAFMHDPEILILDEPTSGLDPLMQKRFIDLIRREKACGKTILMSSHIFEEVEKTCDEVIIIKEGYIVHKSDVQTLKSSQRKGFIIKTTDNEQTIKSLGKGNIEASVINGDSLEVYVRGDDVDHFIKTISKHEVKNFTVKTQTLEDLFMKYYGKED